MDKSKTFHIKSPFDMFNIATGQLNKWKEVWRSRDFHLSTGDIIFLSDTGEEMVLIDYLEFCDRNNQLVYGTRQDFRNIQINKILHEL